MVDNKQAVTKSKKKVKKHILWCSEKVVEK